uniref:Uncharacterized protein n=1 Tax=Aegilops tauschii subsp. strangulata TaxID=200361 RepID=A0A453HL42_AEGTS
MMFNNCFLHLEFLSSSTTKLCRCHSKMGRNVVYMFFTSSIVFFKTENWHKFLRIKHWKKISASWCVILSCISIFLPLPCST